MIRRLVEYFSGPPADGVIDLLIAERGIRAMDDAGGQRARWASYEPELQRQALRRRIQQLQAVLSRQQPAAQPREPLRLTSRR